MILCDRCAKRINKLDEFPGGLCLDCYAVINENMTAQESYAIVMKTFGGK